MLVVLAFLWPSCGDDPGRQVAVDHTGMLPPGPPSEFFTMGEHLTRRALAFDPDNPDVLVKLGRLLRMLGRNEEALDYFIADNKKLPGDFLGLAQIGSCLSELGRPQEAEAYIRRALEGLDDALTRYNLGVVLGMTGRLDEAIAEYRKAVDRNPEDLNARNNLATALARQGKLPAAIEELRQVLARDPENGLARANLDTIRGLRRVE
jgi:superkiller protein 3